VLKIVENLRAGAHSAPQTPNWWGGGLVSLSKNPIPALGRPFDLAVQWKIPDTSLVVASLLALSYGLDNCGPVGILLLYCRFKVRSETPSSSALPLPRSCGCREALNTAVSDRRLMRWLQLRFDFDSTTVRLLIEGH